MAPTAHANGGGTASRLGRRALAVGEHDDERARAGDVVLGLESSLRASRIRYLFARLGISSARSALERKARRPGGIDRKVVL